MNNGWYHYPHRETRLEFEKRAIELSNWILSLVDSEPDVSTSNNSTNLMNSTTSTPTSQSVVQVPIPTSTSTYVFVLHGYLLTTLINQLLYLKPSSCVLIHNNTGITHIELVKFQSGNRGSVLQYFNSLPHLHGRKDLLTGNDLIRDQWIKIFQ